MSRRSIPLLAAGMMLILAHAHAFAVAQAPSPEPLAGTWILNVAKSTLAGAPPRSRYRTIDVTHDGMLHVTYGTVDDRGGNSFGFWEARTDGTQAIEYMRSTGAAPYAVLHVKRAGPRAIAVTAERNGALSSEVTFSVSDDGKTLTEDMTSHTDRGKVRNIRVYDRQP